MPKQPRGREEARGEEVAASRWDSLQVSFVSTSANLALARELSEVRISRSRELSRPDRSYRPRCYPPQSLIVMIACHATSDNLQWCPNIETKWIPWNFELLSIHDLFPHLLLNPQEWYFSSQTQSPNLVLSCLVAVYLLMPVVSDDPKGFSMTVDGSDAGGLTLHKVPIHRVKWAVGTLGTTEGPRVAKRLVGCLGTVWKTFWLALMQFTSEQ